MTKEELVIALVSKGLPPDEAYAVSCNFKDGLRLLGKMNSFDRKKEKESALKTTEQNQ